MKAEYLARHFDILPPEATKKSIVVIGAGAIGSFTVLALAKMGYENIKVYDFDTVENENMNCQFYPTFSIGQPKVDALKAMITTFCGFEIETFNEEITEDSPPFMADYLICAVDSMAVRKMLWEKHNASQWLIDPRMGAEYASMEVVHCDDDKVRKESYAKSLYSDSDAVQERCTAKSTIYTVMLIAGQIAKAVKDTSTDNNYLKTLDWNIAENAIMAWDSRGSMK